MHLCRTELLKDKRTGGDKNGVSGSEEPMWVWKTVMIEGKSMLTPKSMVNGKEIELSVGQNCLMVKSAEINMQRQLDALKFAYENSAH